VTLRLKNFHQVATKVAILFLSVAATMAAQQSPHSPSVVRLVQGTLVAPGSTPFHLKAQISEGGEEPETFVELFWQAPDRWRRTIQSDQFVQTLVVNKDKTFEHDSPMYMPPEVQILLTAMVDPQPIINALQPEDLVRTKANGASLESGRTCVDPAHRDLFPKIRTQPNTKSYFGRGAEMSKSKHTDAQMIAALKQVEAGRKVEDVAREVGVSKHTIYAWKAKYGGMDVSEAQEARQLRDENSRLRKLVADLSLDKEALQSVIRKNGWSS
jgi:putative transposase